jgi:hypothetical protein
MANDQFDLKSHLESVMEEEKKYGWQNYRWYQAVAILSLSGSVAATVLGAVGRHPVLTSVCAVTPATVLAITKVFPFESRAFAHWRKEYKVKGLLLRLTEEGEDAKTVSREFRDLEAAAFQDWQFSDLAGGTSSVKPQQPPPPQAAT